MTTKETKEMIAVLEAYINGEEIEFSLVYDDDWHHISIPNWNWEQYKYRIKPKEEEKIKTKFKQGDKIVHKELCNGAPLNKDNDFLIIEDIFKNKYVVYNKRKENTDNQARNDNLDAFESFDIKEIDEDYVNADDCLWHWEYYDENYKTFAQTTLRYNKKDCIDYLQKITSDLTPTPIYQLGARLPKEHE